MCYKAVKKIYSDEIMLHTWYTGTCRRSSPVPKKISLLHNSLWTRLGMTSCKKSCIVSLRSWQTPSQELAGSIGRWELMLAGELWEPLAGGSNDWCGVHVTPKPEHTTLFWFTGCSHPCCRIKRRMLSGVIVISLYHLLLVWLLQSNDYSIN